jgi:predicted ArsR family transcriptional regulator
MWGTAISNLILVLNSRIQKGDKEVAAMGRKVEKKYELGTYTAEFVDEMKPLAEDRKTQFLPDSTSETMARLSGRTLGIFLANIMCPLAGRFGDEVWEVAKKAMYEVGRQRAATMVRTMKIDDLKDARCIGRIMDLEDNNSGIKGEWVEFGKKRAVKHEYECPLDTPCKKCPKVCSVLLEAMEQGTMDGLGIKLKNPIIITKTLTTGDRYCEVVIEPEN